MAFPTLGPWITGTVTQKLLRMGQAGALGRPTATFAGGVSPTTDGGSHGVVGGDDMKVTISSGLTLSVAPGAAYINGTSSTTQGNYYTYNDAATTIALAAHSAQPRIDLVYVRARDNAEDSGGVTQISGPLAVTGTPAGSPSVPAVPSGSLVLAQVAVPATSGAVVITDTRPYAAALGGFLRTKSTLRPSGVAAWQGVPVFETDTNRLRVNTSTTVGTPVWRMIDGKMGATLVQLGQSIGSGATASVNWDVETEDTDSLHAGTSSNVTIPETATYAVSVNATPGLAVSSFCDVVLYVGASAIATSYIPTGKAVGSVSVTLPLGVGDVLSAQIYNGHSSSASFAATLRVYRVSS